METRSRKNIIIISSSEPFSFMYQSIFINYCFSCTNFEDKARDCKSHDVNDYKSNYQASSSKFAGRQDPNGFNSIN